MENVKRLRDLSELERAPALEEFALVDGRGQDVELLLPVLRNPNIRKISAGFGSDRKNNVFSKLRQAHGKQELMNWASFEYR